MVLVGWGCLFVFGSGRWSSLHQGGQPSNGIGKVEGRSGGPCRMSGIGMAGGPLALMNAETNQWMTRTRENKEPR